jgi:hypothetical protein
MKPGQWPYWSDPEAMLNAVRRGASPRKLRLLGCACCHRAWSLLTDTARRIVQLSELVADGLAERDALLKEVRPLSQEVYRAVEGARGVTVFDGDPEEADPTEEEEFARLSVALQASFASILATTSGSRTAVRRALDLLADLVGWNPGEERRAQCHLIRDVFGNPFKPIVVDHAWLRWNNGFVPKMAHAIYDDYTFQDLPILADALEEAGCNNKDVLQHCRSRKDHVRGCFVVDLVIGKR